MAVLTTRVDANTDEARKNSAAMTALVEELRARTAAVSERGAAGDERSIARHRERGKLPVRERIEHLLDPGAPFLELPEAFKGLQRVLLQRSGGDREMVEILALVLHHEEQAVLTAVELALESGAPSKEHVLNLLSRLIQAAAPPPVSAPQALALEVEPQANVSRYDGLREGNRAA